MNYRANRRDLQASFIAAAATLLTVALNGPPEWPETEASAHLEADQQALRGLIGADQAQSDGGWMLDSSQVAPKLSFAPEYERLVWHVEGPSADVLLDAKTGEALEFRFE